MACHSERKRVNPVHREWKKKLTNFKKSNSRKAVNDSLDAEFGGKTETKRNYMPLYKKKSKCWLG